MLQYAICEIGGKQYKVIPNQDLLIDYQGEDKKEIEAKVVLLSEDGKVKIEKGDTKEKLMLTVLANVRGEKIRVAKFHAKANFRKVKGARAHLTKVSYVVKKS